MTVLKWIGLSFGAVVVLIAAILWLLTPPRLAVAEQRALTLSGMTLINPLSSRVSDYTLFIEDGRISAVEALPAESDFDCEGCFVLPGLMDMHVHFPPKFVIGQQEQFAVLFLAHGVTGVRDAGSADQSTYVLRDRILAGDLVGPRIMTCGPIIDGDPPVFPTNVAVATGEAARAAVRNVAEAGGQCMKAYNMLSPSAFEGLTDEAARAGLPIMGHVPHGVDLANIRNFDVQHVTGIVEYAPEDIGFDDYRFADIARVSDERLAEVIAIAQANDISFTPTLINQVRRRTWADEDRFPPDEVSDELPRFWATAWRAIFGGPFSSYTEEDHANHLSRQREIVLALHDAGVTIRAGTDTMMPWSTPGSALIGELHELVRAGLTPEEALAAATVNGGSFFPESGVGRISPGGPADIVIYREDPTQNLAALDTLEAVIVDGRLYTREELEIMRGQYRRHFRGGVYDGVMTRLMSLIMGTFAPDQGDE